MVRVLLVLFAAAIVVAESPCAELSDAEASELFAQGKDLFRRGNSLVATEPDQARNMYRMAAMRFERIVREGAVRNGKLYYNIGNAYFRMEDLGRAILNYRRAAQLIPNDPNLQQNLQFARERRRDDIAEKSETRALKTFFFWHYDVSTRTRSAVFGVCFLLIWVAATIRFFWRRTWLGWCGAVAVLFTALSLGSLLVEAWTQGRNRPGVVVAGEVIARKGDGENYEQSFRAPLHAGTEFRLREDRDEWVEIELDDGRACWVPAVSVEMVR